MNLPKAGPNPDSYLQKVKEIMKRTSRLSKEHQIENSKEKKLESLRFKGEYIAKIAPGFQEMREI